MLQISPEVKEELRALVSVTTVLREFAEANDYPVRQQGDEFRTLCPFEESVREMTEGDAYEKGTNTSKFRVSAERYHCYGCGENGDVFKWFTEYQAMTWPEAVEEVARRAKFDLTPYRHSGRETPEDRQRRLISEALAVVAALSRSTALALPEAERVIGGQDVSVLIEAGELGLLPDAAAIGAALDAAGVDARIRAASGIERAGAQFARRWVFWARRRDTVVAGRLFGRPGPIVGVAGAKSGGWTLGPVATTPAARKRAVLVALDDRQYVTLRRLGVMSVARPVSPGSLRQSRDVRRFDAIETPPVLLVPPDPEARAEAFEQGLGALGVNPRLRAIEWDGESVTADGADAFVAHVTREAGTLLDWQLDRLARTGGFNTPDRLARSRERLQRVVGAVGAHPVEAAVYQSVMDEVTTPPAARPTVPGRPPVA